MANTITKVPGADFVAGNKRFRVRDIAFSGNYATGGETITAASVGLKKIDQVQIQGQVAPDSTTGANPVGVSVASTGASFTLRLFELGGTGAAGDPLLEKTNAEAYLTSQTVRVMVIGW